MGPHDVISINEAIGTLAVLGLMLVAMIWMAYRTRWHSH
jgi:cbb3-type cytochrome oxidase subunit 3